MRFARKRQRPTKNKAWLALPINVATTPIANPTVRPTLPAGWRINCRILCMCYPFVYLLIDAILLRTTSRIEMNYRIWFCVSRHLAQITCMPILPISGYHLSTIHVQKTALKLLMLPITLYTLRGSENAKKDERKLRNNRQLLLPLYDLLRLVLI